ncbi:MAG TPA: carboxypeptidase-like regulatory domain-containing protein [Thermoanaerobaculia bacterium]|nr:carboxypeptidase-like regulatory domain-containing protein [Thermoanaerobaculia bacterium]
MLRSTILLGAFWLLPAAMSAAETVPCTSLVRFELRPKAPMAEGLQGKLVLRPIEEKREPVEVPARMAAPATAELPCGSSWEVSPVFADVWGPRATVIAGGAGQTAVSTVTLWPLGKIAGSLKPIPQEDRPPKALSIATLAPRGPAQRDLPKGILDCPIEKSGKWTCPPLPAATFDLVLSAEGFIPQYRWGVKVVAGKTIDLGMVELKRGASVAGWVEVEEGVIAGGCRARLAPLLGEGSGAQMAEKIRTTIQEVPVRKDGFFQLVGIAPGNYSLEVRQPGFAPATVYPIEVWPRLETFLRVPVTLKRPLQLELAVSPALDWLNRPWRVQVFRSSDVSASNDAVFNGAADSQGLVAIPRQAPGRFQVSVADSLGNPLYFREFRVTGPGDASQSVEIKVLTVRGSVSLGKEPLAATLWFGGRYGATAVKMESDRDGKFHGVVPRGGWWAVEVAAAEPRFETRTKVKLEPDGQDRVWADLKLPATRVFGKVVDDAGQPVSAASFGLSTDDGPVNTDTDRTGGFEVRGVRSGMAYAAATSSSAQGTWTSDRIAVFIGEDAEVGPLELRMHKNKTLTGTVQSSRGPVPGAGVSVIPLRPTVMFGDSVRSELDGGFTAQVPASTEVADVIVSPPGFALRAFAVPLGEAAAQPLTVSAEGGSLEVLFPEKPKDAEKDEYSLWIFQDGLPLPVNLLHQWIAGHGSGAGAAQGKKLVVPQVAPGAYRACLAAQAIIVPWEASGFTAPMAKCTAGQLSAGSTLQLDLAQR